MRLYWSRILRRTHWTPTGTLPGQSGERFSYRLVYRYKLLNVYEAPTLSNLYQQLKADGHQVWGYNDILDYSWPENAFEYALFRELLEKRGLSEAEIDDYLSYESES